MAGAVARTQEKKQQAEESQKQEDEPGDTLGSLIREFATVLFQSSLPF
jgi:hypothetical protein